MKRPPHAPRLTFLHRDNVHHCAAGAGGAPLWHMPGLRGGGRPVAQKRAEYAIHGRKARPAGAQVFAFKRPLPRESCASPPRESAERASPAHECHGSLRKSCSPRNALASLRGAPCDRNTAAGSLRAPQQHGAAQPRPPPAAPRWSEMRASLKKRMRSHTMGSQPTMLIVSLYLALSSIGPFWP
jgi:hypothetical protein